MLILEATSSLNAAIGAIALRDHEIRCFDIATGKQISVLKSPYDFGGNRVLLNRTGYLCFSASYIQRTVACMSVLNGNLLWSQRCRKPTQALSLSRNEDLLYCGLDDGSTDVLSAQTGKLQKDLSPIAASTVFESPLHDLIVHDTNRTLIFNSGKHEVGSIPIQTFAMIAHSFSPNFFCMSESGGTVRFFAINSFTEEWEFSPKADSHVINLAYSGGGDIVFGMEWPYVHGGAYRFFELSPTRMSATQVFDIEIGSGIANLDTLGRALAGDGRIFDIRTGTQIGSLQLCE